MAHVVIQKVGDECFDEVLLALVVQWGYLRIGAEFQYLSILLLLEGRIKELFRSVS